MERERWRDGGGIASILRERKEKKEEGKGRTVKSLGIRKESGKEESETYK